MAFSSIMKLVSWEERNKSVNVMMTSVAKISTDGLTDLFYNGECQDLMNEISRVKFRINDELVKDGEQLNRDNLNDLTLKKVGSRKIGKKIGTSQVLRLNLKGINIEPDASRSRFPFDSAIIPIDFDFFAIKKLMYKKEGKLVVYEKYCKNKDDSDDKKERVTLPADAEIE